MNSLPTSVILLLVAIVLLWLAVTDKLSRLLDAYDVLRGDAKVANASGTPGSPTVTTQTAYHLPSLPPLAINAQVPA